MRLTVSVTTCTVFGTKRRSERPPTEPGVDANARPSTTPPPFASIPFTFRWCGMSYTTEDLRAAWEALQLPAKLTPYREGFSGSCPAHRGEDPNAKLRIGDDGNVAGACYSRGCALKVIREALGMPYVGQRRPVRQQTYTYRRADGSQKKDVRRDYSDLSKDYRLTDNSPVEGCRVEILESDVAGAPVVLNEGRKSAESLHSKVSTHATAHGPGGWGGLKLLDYEPLRGRDVICWADADPDGLNGMIDAVEALEGIAASVKWVDIPPDVPPKWDAADCPAELAAELLDSDSLVAVPRVPRVPRRVNTHGLEVSRSVSSQIGALKDDGGHGGHGGHPPPEPQTIRMDTRGYVDALETLAEYRMDLRSSTPHARSELLQELEPGPELYGGWRPLTDPLMQRLMGVVAERFNGLNGKPAGESVERFRAAMRYAAATHKGDVIRDWFADLPEWDGTERVERLFIDALAAEDSVLARAGARVLLVGAVARTLQPGCKHDQVVILAGKQGGGKSTLVRALLPPTLQELYFRDAISLAGTAKQICEAIAEALFVEFSELSGMERSELAYLKAFLSGQSDTYRAAYGYFGATKPRMWVGVGTVNPDPTRPGYLPPDPTGNRRFIAVPVGAPGPAVAVAWCEENREQLWAEALHLYVAGAKHWLDDAETVVQDQANRELVVSAGRIEDACDTFIAWYETNMEWGTPVRMVTVLETGGLLREGEAPDDKDERPMGIALVNRGWEKHQARLSDGRLKRWYPPTLARELIPSAETCCACGRPRMHYRRHEQSPGVYCPGGYGIEDAERHPCKAAPADSVAPTETPPQTREELAKKLKEDV